VLGIDSVLKASGAVTSAFIKSEVGRRCQCAPELLYGSEHDGAASMAPRAGRITEQLRLRSFRLWPHELYAWSRPQR
jgi:hypothetical protein